VKMEQRLAKMRQSREVSNNLTHIGDFRERTSNFYSLLPPAVGFCNSFSTHWPLAGPVSPRRQTSTLGFRLVCNGSAAASTPRAEHAWPEPCCNCTLSGNWACLRCGQSRPGVESVYACPSVGRGGRGRLLRGREDLDSSAPMRV
jgi:hypothetical protein